MAATILVELFSASTNWHSFPTLYFIFNLYFCKKVVFSAMAPVNNRNTYRGVKRKHKSQYILLTFHLSFFLLINCTDRRNGAVVRASASQSVEEGFISLVESFQKTLKNGIHSFPAWRSAHKG